MWILMKIFFKDAKEKYENIKAPESLKSRIKMRFKKKNFVLAKVCGVVATFLIVSIVGVNVSPVFAENLSSLPGMQTVVKILTGSKYTFDKDTYHAKIDVPEITELGNSEVEESINAEIKEMAEELIENFKSDVIELQENGLGAHLSLESGYEILTDNEDVFAFDVWTVNAVGSSSTTHKFYSINKQTKSLIELSDFIKDDNVKQKVNDYIRAEISRRQDRDNGIIYFENDFKGIKDDQGFYINANNDLVIVFEKYSIAPGSMGSPEFVIPREIFK